MGSVQPEPSKVQTWMAQLFPEHLNLGSPHTHFQVPVLETELTAPFHASIFLIDKLHAGLAYHNFTDIPHGGLVYGSLLDIPRDVLAHRSLPATQTRLLATCYWLKIILTSGSSLVLLLPWFSGISQHLFLEEVDS